MAKTWYNEMDRSPLMSKDPREIKPLGNKVIIKRKMGEQRSGSIYIPEDSEAARAGFEGEVIAIGGKPGPDEENVKIGDYVYFSPGVNWQDSTFLRYGNEYFAIIPYEAIQMVKVAI